eukprot:TRINITY_DN108104_c0_g1_i1.p1 TRINITY_DN108104_c0_g1~~TRINITY_DN108104_c0_g1_i1.p1  ORF type:complete len:393 (+),score=87.87 TRINITY_DN108104_c0_g1_i1:84-1262(+)
MKQTPGSECNSLDRTFDWPLSRTEKKDVLMRISRRDLEDQARQLQRMRVSAECQSGIPSGETSELSSVKPSKGSRTTQGHKTSLDGWEPHSEPSGTPRQLEPEAELLCTPRRLILESGVPEINPAEALSGKDVKQTLESLQEQMARQQQEQFEAFQRLQQQQMKEFLARFQTQGSETKHEESDSDCESRERITTARSCPERALRTTPPRPALKRRSRGDSLGGSAQRVRFVEEDAASSDEESDVKLCTTSAVARGRSRRISRGPDGRAYTIPDKTGKTDEASSKRASQPAGDFTKAAAGSFAGGALGLGAGILGGAVAALPAALFTFGLSIPIGAAFGGGLGCSAGASAGALVGYKMGSDNSSESKEQTLAAKEPEESEESEGSEKSYEPGE